MATLAIELSDAGFQAATCEEGEPRYLPLVDKNGSPEWPGFAYHDGQKFLFGRAAEDAWFIHPRRVAHTFWDRLAHEPSSLNVPGKLPSFSELAFNFLLHFSQELKALTGPPEKVVLAVPSVYLKDSATEEEKIGLLLGMANELNLPLAGIIDMACAGLCDPRAAGFHPSLPVITLDIHLEGADLSLLVQEEELARRKCLHLPGLGYAHLLKQVNGTMGNRFLRNSAFDILEDGRIEQIFFRQTKEFLLKGESEFRYQINTSNRNYEMRAKSEQLVADAQPFAASLVHGLLSFTHASLGSPDGCTLALTHRAQSVPGLEARVRAAGFRRLLRLPAGAAACGAASTGARRFKVPAEVADVAVETSVPLTETRRSVNALWETRLLKAPAEESRPTPTHVILDGIGHVLGKQGRFLIGRGAASDVALPESFNGFTDCAVPLVREGGRLWFVDHSGSADSSSDDASAPRTAVGAGDRLTIRYGTASAEVLFVHCAEAANGHRA